MASLANELYNRGSKLCMQICVNNETDEKYWISRKNLLDNKIGLGEINWISPVTKDNYKEYQLNEISDLFKTKINWNEFWPSRQSQWDGIGIAPDGTIILVEAKAHSDEIDHNGTDKTGATGRSLELIKSRIYEAFDSENEKLINNYYQLANRFTFLNKLLDEGEKVLLVFLYFINDVTHICSTKDEYEKYLNNGFRKDVKIPTKLKDNYKIVYLDLWNDSGLNKNLKAKD